jgi:N-acetylglucosaminyldiphosphoundecaprenol N-acetyl-beta-D-mannosaminyltransferase
MSGILGVNVASTSYAEVVAKAVEWAKTRQSRTLVFANVHVIMEAFDNPKLRNSLNAADLVNPDGVPLVWALKLLGNKQASRVYGPDCTLAMLEAAASNGIPVGFYGGSPDVLDKLSTEVRERYPEITISILISPPFRETTAEEDADFVQQITDSGTGILFIGLGCPKQELWMMSHAGRIPAVMFAVGAAFDFIAGTKAQAPRWMMRSGTEWLFRLSTEPKRLYRRYAKQNPRFVWYFARQLASQRRQKSLDLSI